MSKMYVKDVYKLTEHIYQEIKKHNVEQMTEKVMRKIALRELLEPISMLQIFKLRPNGDTLELVENNGRIFGFVMNRRLLTSSVMKPITDKILTKFEIDENAFKRLHRYGISEDVIK